MTNWKQYSIEVRVKDSSLLQEFKENLEYREKLQSQIIFDSLDPNVTSEEFHQRYPWLSEEVWDD